MSPQSTRVLWFLAVQSVVLDLATSGMVYEAQSCGEYDTDCVIQCHGFRACGSENAWQFGQGKTLECPKNNCNECVVECDGEQSCQSAVVVGHSCNKVTVQFGASGNDPGRKMQIFAPGAGGSLYVKTPEGPANTIATDDTLKDTEIYSSLFNGKTKQIVVYCRGTHAFGNDECENVVIHGESAQRVELQCLDSANCNNVQVKCPLGSNEKIPCEFECNDAKNCDIKALVPGSNWNDELAFDCPQGPCNLKVTCDDMKSCMMQGTNDCSGGDAQCSDGTVPVSSPTPAPVPPPVSSPTPAPVMQKNLRTYYLEVSVVNPSHRSGLIYYQIEGNYGMKTSLVGVDSFLSQGNTFMLAALLEDVGHADKLYIVNGDASQPNLELNGVGADDDFFYFAGTVLQYDYDSDDSKCSFIVVDFTTNSIGDYSNSYSECPFDINAKPPTPMPTIADPPTLSPTVKIVTSAPTLSPTVKIVTSAPTDSPITPSPTLADPPTDSPTVADPPTDSPTFKIQTSAPTVSPTVAVVTNAPTMTPTVEDAVFEPTMMPSVPTAAPISAEKACTELGAKFMTTEYDAGWRGKRAYLVVEAEDFKVDDDAVQFWQFENKLKGYDGEGYMTWRGENLYFWGGDYQMTAKVFVQHPGLYYFTLRGYQFLDYEGSKGDLSNDVWIRFSDSVDSYGYKKSEETVICAAWWNGNTRPCTDNWWGPLKQKEGWVKYLRSGSNWDWGYNNVEIHHEFVDFVVDWSVAGVYTIELAGRSEYFSIDKVALWRKEDKDVWRSDFDGKPSSVCTY